MTIPPMEAVMVRRGSARQALLRTSCFAISFCGLIAVGALSAHAEDDSSDGDNGRLVVASSYYTGTASTIAVGQALPNSTGAKAVADGSYPGVFNNDTPDGNFGITSPIIVSSYRTTTARDRGTCVTDFLGWLDVTRATGVSTSFSSKSELSVNLSTDGPALTLMGYVALVNTLDVSNVNTPGIGMPATPTRRRPPTAPSCKST